ncbi:MAG: hypothetical protein QF554_14075 [Dehalococcoidia bacterium]|nr:hypothetical protein [Dehalococcoidia bacterium]
MGITTERTGHSVVVVGHTFLQDSWWRQMEGHYFPSLVSGRSWVPSFHWIPEYIVQDDNFGPYLSTPREELGQIANTVVVPVPESLHVNLEPWDAELLVANIVLDRSFATRFFQRPSDPIQTQWGRLLADAISDGNVVFRTILVSKPELIKHYSARGLIEKPGWTDSAEALPEWAWLVEISDPILFPHRMKLGDFIVDPTYPMNLIRNGTEAILMYQLLDAAVDSPARDWVDVPDFRPMPVYSRPTFGQN